MITTRIYNGQGLGNQLWCYVVTRVIAEENGYAFGIASPERLKCFDFMNLDTGLEVVGGTGPEGGPPRSLPNGIRYYYNEQALFHPHTKLDIRTYDDYLFRVPDATQIDGIMQDEAYIRKYKDKIRTWLAVKPEVNNTDYASDTVCVINFRGGEYTRIPDVFLTQKYWNDAIVHMQKINPDFRFVVVTDDPRTARKFFPNFEISHKSIGSDYSIILNAQYLILSNSSFAWFPAWLSTTAKKIIAPKYWAAHNVSDGYWSTGYSLTTGFEYLDRNGQLHSYEECCNEYELYKKSQPTIYKKYPPANYTFKKPDLLTMIKTSTPAKKYRGAKRRINLYLSQGIHKLRVLLSTKKKTDAF